MVCDEQQGARSERVEMREREVTELLGGFVWFLCKRGG